MSLDIIVYCKGVSAELVPKILKRLNDYDMVVEVHPDFKFEKEKDEGFVPFKFQLKNPTHKRLSGKELKSGFELYISDFNFNDEKERLQPKLSFFDKLRGKKKEETAFAPTDVEERLKECNKAISFVWHAGDIFQLRFASLTSAILTELTNGVCSYPADEIWYDNKNIVSNAFEDARNYEKSVSENDLKFLEFDEWQKFTLF